MNKKEFEHLKQRILDILPHEKENAIRLVDISAITGTKPRTLKEAITELRNDFAICAKETDGGGYWIGHTNQEVREYIIMIEKHKAGYDRTIDKMTKFL